MEPDGPLSLCFLEGRIVAECFSESGIGVSEGGELEIGVTPFFLCPQGYVEVEPNPLVGTTEKFCVAKYEMKNATDDIAESRAKDEPWIIDSRAEAITACQANGPEYRLISNSEWMTVARSIEQELKNWFGKTTLGNSQISQGHSGIAPGNFLSASPNDNESCYLMFMSCGLTRWNPNKRTSFLSNQSVIWDFTGNAWEVILMDSGDVNAEPFSTLSEWQGVNQVKAGPIFTTTQFQSLDLSLTESQGIGSVYTGPLEPFNGQFKSTIRRGGGRNSEGKSGLYSMITGTAGNLNYDRYGFRCVFSPDP